MKRVEAAHGRLDEFRVFRVSENQLQACICKGILFSNIVESALQTAGDRLTIYCIDYIFISM